MQQSLAISAPSSPLSLSSPIPPAPLSLSERSDAELAPNIARQDCAAFEQIYDRYAGKAFGLCICILGDHKISEEVLQEAFWQVWQKAGGFDPAYTQFSTWLFSIVYQYAIVELRKRRSQAQTIHNKRAGIDTAGMESVLANLESQPVKAALAQLPAVQRSIIMLAYYGGHTLPEIAVHLGEPLIAVQTHARLGLAKLRYSSF